MTPRILNLNQKPATIGFMKAFAAKCKSLFQLNPICSLSESTKLWIKISTSLPINNFDNIYLNVKCIGDHTIESNIYVHASNGIINVITGINLGTTDVKQAIIIGSASNKLDIILKLDTPFDNCIVNILSLSGEEILYSPIDNVEFLEEYQKEGVYWWAYNNDSEYEEEDRQPIGTIYNQLNVETNFYIQEDEQSIQEYSLGQLFSKIYQASEADKLSHNITFQYDWETEATESDEPVNLGNLQENEVIKIPVPKGLVNLDTEDGDYNTISVYDGNIVRVSNNPVGVSLATESSVGGMKLGAVSEQSYEDGRKVWVRLDDFGKAFIDKNDVKGQSPSDINWITEQEIDYLFEKHVETVSIAPSITGEEGSLQNVSLTIIPVDAYYTSVSWEVTNENIVTANNGVLFLRAEGECDVTCVVYDGEQIFRSNVCHVTVDALQPVEAE